MLFTQSDLGFSARTVELSDNTPAALSKSHGIWGNPNLRFFWLYMAVAMLIAAAMTLMLYLVNNFLRWWLHYLQHKIPVRREFHKVHHSAEHLNFATSERYYPFDILFFPLASFWLRPS